MKPSIIITSILSIILLFSTGCTTVTQQEIASANYGPYPVSYQSDIRNLMGQILKDPYSAQYRFGSPQKGFAQDGIAVGRRKHFGWIIPVWVNAKNSFGGYTGEKLYYIMIADGSVGDITNMFHGGMARFVE